MNNYDGVKSKAKSGVLWNIFGTYGNMVVMGLTTVVLARVLGPDVYGTIYSVMVFIGFLPILISLGFEQALVASNDVEEKDFESVFTLILILSVVLTAAFAVCLPYLLKKYTVVDEVNIVYGLVLLIMANGIGIVPKAILSKNLGFAELNKSLVMATPVPGVIAVGMALYGFGIWALVAQQLLNAIIRTGLYYYFSKWRPKINFDFERLQRFRSFCANLLADQTLFYLAKNSDIAVIAAMFTPGVVGFYSKAMETLRKPITQVNTIFLSVLFPSLSKIRDDEDQLNAVGDKLLLLISFIVFPTIAVLGLLSEEIVLVLYGEKWLGMVVFMKIFSIGIAITPLTYVGTNTILAKGKTRSLLLSNIIYRALLLGSIGVLAFLGTPPIYYAIAVTIGFIMQYIIVMFFWKKVSHRKSLFNLKIISRALSITVFALVIGWWVQMQLQYNHPVLIILTVATLFSIVYGVVSIFVNPKPIKILFNNIPEKYLRLVPSILLNKIINDA